ncbi:hypothetical protein ACROYT_G015319 [Oculina patagonica]
MPQLRNLMKTAAEYDAQEILQLYKKYSRCKCSNCSLEFVVKHKEYRCYTEVNRCVEQMEKLKEKANA